MLDTHELSHHMILVLLISLFWRKDTDVQKGEVTCVRAHNQQANTRVCESNSVLVITMINSSIEQRTSS